MPSAVEAQSQVLAPKPLISLFDITPAGSEDVYRIHAANTRKPVHFGDDDNEYIFHPCEISGITASAENPSDNPVFRVGNIDGLISNIIREYDGLEGAKITRHRVFVKDEESGALDYDVQFVPEVWYVSRKMEENELAVAFELQSPIEVDDVSFPRRPVGKQCVWKYRGEECGYRDVEVPAEDETIGKWNIGASANNGNAEYFNELPIQVDLSSSGFAPVGEHASAIANPADVVNGVSITKISLPVARTEPPPAQNVSVSTLAVVNNPAPPNNSWTTLTTPAWNATSAYPQNAYSVYNNTLYRAASVVDLPDATYTPTATTEQARWTAGFGGNPGQATYNAGTYNALEANNTEASGDFPSDTSGIWRLRQVGGGTVVGPMNIISSTHFVRFRVGSQNQMRAAFGNASITIGGLWVLDKVDTYTQTAAANDNPSVDTARWTAVSTTEWNGAQAYNQNAIVSRNNAYYRANTNISAPVQTNPHSSGTINITSNGVNITQVSLPSGSNTLSITSTGLTNQKRFVVVSGTDTITFNAGASTITLSSAEATTFRAQNSITISAHNAPSATVTNVLTITNTGLTSAKKFQVIVGGTTIDFALGANTKTLTGVRPDKANSIAGSGELGAFINATKARVRVLNSDDTGVAGTQIGIYTNNTPVSGRQITSEDVGSRVKLTIADNSDNTLNKSHEGVIMDFHETKAKTGNDARVVFDIGTEEKQSTFFNGQDVRSGGGTFTITKRLPATTIKAEYITLDGKITSNPVLDDCPHNVRGCKRRHLESEWARNPRNPNQMNYINKTLPYGGWPGARAVFYGIALEFFLRFASISSTMI